MDGERRAHSRAARPGPRAWLSTACCVALLLTGCAFGSPAGDPEPVLTQTETDAAGADGPMDGAPTDTQTPIGPTEPTEPTGPTPATEDNQLTETSGPNHPSEAAPGATPPEWLGTRVLPRRSDGHGVAQPTPPELDPRAFTLPAELPPPPDGAFASAVREVPEDVLARSSWHPGCPVSVAQLRYVTVSFWGFDDAPHTGELLLHRDAAEPVVEAFRQLFEARFPIEQMRITRAEEVDAPPTGDTNNTGAFVCRDTVASGQWSQHAYGRAVDINPFQNPYQKGSLVIPELASSYLDRGRDRPGMIHRDGVAVQAFDQAGWGWGGRWRSSKDYMHFSASGR